MRRRPGGSVPFPSTPPYTDVQWTVLAEEQSVTTTLATVAPMDVPVSAEPNPPMIVEEPTAVRAIEDTVKLIVDDANEVRSQDESVCYRCNDSGLSEVSGFTADLASSQLFASSPPPIAIGAYKAGQWRFWSIVIPDHMGSPGEVPLPAQHFEFSLLPEVHDALVHMCIFYDANTLDIPVTSD